MTLEMLYPCGADEEAVDFITTFLHNDKNHYNLTPVCIDIEKKGRFRTMDLAPIK